MAPGNLLLFDTQGVYALEMALNNITSKSEFFIKDLKNLGISDAVFKKGLIVIGIVCEEKLQI